MKTYTVLTSILDDETLFEGEAEVEKTGTESLVIVMKNEDCDMVWKLLAKGIRIENRNEFETNLTLFEKGYGKAKITTPFGTLDCPADDVKISYGQGWASVSYLLNGTDLFSFRLLCDAIGRQEKLDQTDPAC